MEEQYIEQIAKNLYGYFNHVGVEAFDINNELEQVTHPITREKPDKESLRAIEERFLQKTQYKRSHDGAILIPVSVVSDPRLHEEWYPEWWDIHNNDESSYYWKRLEDHLSRELTRKYGPDSAAKVVRSIDDATYRIMDKLANPARKEFSYKGMVVGYVQSGKTANFTTLIAKAADAGYKFIVVLAGIHNVLRRQTQVRLDQELTGIRDVESEGAYIAQPGAAKAWNRLTSADSDFFQGTHGLFSGYCERVTPTLAVVKKNVRVLERLIEYVSEANSEARANMPILIIDDEADQASVDGNANDPDADPTRTNERIRTLLSYFSRKTYVGYTATPFANALIDLTTEHDGLEDDLYPRNFVVSLPKPEGYFGAARIFQGDLSDYFVQQIPSERNQLYRTGEITTSLARSIDQFLLGCAVRNLRLQKEKPMSMLVHVSHIIDEMAVAKRIVEGYMEDLKSRYRDAVQSAALKDDMREMWNDYSENAAAINRDLKLENFLPDYNEVWTELDRVFQVLQVLELNSRSDDTLDYTTGEEIKVIAVGGNQLSRGLTLEGLMISYYLRESRQYDTLLQMARWFGYRHGYEDLTRIHTTARIWEFFEHLALVEQELRSEIYRYEEDGLTPMQMALAIRDHRTLSVTAPNKMGAAMMRQTSFSESLNQTIWFPLDQPEVLRENWYLGSRFIEAIDNDTDFTNVNDTGVFLSNDKVDGAIVLEFLNGYSFAGTESTGGPGLPDQLLLEYIDRRLNHASPELTQWSVAVVGNANPTLGVNPVDFGGLQINPLGRSRRYSEKGYNIGVLTESPHLRIDLVEGASSPYDNRDSQNPLLLLYLVAKESRARIQPQLPLSANVRVNLYYGVKTAHVDLLGIAIVLPESPQEPNSYLGQLI
ncbi:Z1 domain-containing protein [Owenweeksia hongkongensis DSM 17368]|uniref:Z1 domain-containing protein n=1 Tax=Owenweeksia hongkongensis (strain DSM 17368 / CIP 108786 / JCM 12287 / NRRL B-23963 / UST20020801) TaxID=926562 RepID=G8R873_OWEHD|nr:Z1 domain-containing protein [Owenweeksia hongkongensis]AEV32441.1 Z1 domain-containing protein [Owenweeksia hongkongensis DSM 17368]